MKSYIDLRIVGHDPELGEFLRICQLIQSFGTYGTSRKITISVDGDGSGRLLFGLVNKDGKVEELPDVPHKLLDEKEAKKEQWDMSIGE
jgi:hypothetical protein